MTDVLVLGGGYAGALAAIRLARRTRGKGVTVTLIDANETFTERVRLHQIAAGQTLRRRAYGDLMRKQRAHFVHGRIVEIDLAGRTVRVAAYAGTDRQYERILSYDRLVYALGSRTATNGVPGVAKHTFTLTDRQSAERMKARLAELAQDGGRVAVVGGGLTGLECAAELSETFPSLDVQILTAGAVAPGISERGRDYIRRTLGRLGVTVREKAPVRAVGDGVVHLEGGDELLFNMCVWAGSFVANPLGAAAGLAANGRGRVRVDRSLRSVSHPEVYAVGDAADIEDVPLRMGCATAMPIAAHAADNLAAELNGRPTRPFRFGYLIQCISLGRRNGLIQRVAPDDRPLDRVVTGRPAARIKEMVCRFAFSSLTWEGRGIPYAWSKVDVQHVR